MKPVTIYTAGLTTDKNGKLSFLSRETITPEDGVSGA